MNFSPTMDSALRAPSGFAGAPSGPGLGQRLWGDARKWRRLRAAIDLAVLLGGAAVALALSTGADAADVASAALFALASLILMFSPRSVHKQLAQGILDSCASAVASCAVAAMAAIALGALTGESNPGLVVLRQWLITAGLLCLARVVLGVIERRARSRGRLMTPTLIVGAGIVGSWAARRLAQQPALGLRPVGFLDADPKPELIEDDLGLEVLGSPTEALEVARRTGARQLIFAFSWERDAELAAVVRRCQGAGLEVAIVPRLYEAINDRVTLDHVGGLPLMSFQRLDSHGWQFTAKYAVERATASLCLLAVAPLMIAIALAVKLTSPGPMVYRQRRVGRGGREFDLLKFRSMRLSGPQNGFSPVAGSAPGGVEGDDRRTTVGRWLRNTSLDELPQLLNVVRGEMSLVGPRPERPEFAALFSADVPGYADRHRVKPGITGWAQVNGLRGQTSIADRVEWDNYYIDNWSIRLELRTIALTIAAMMSFREDRKPSSGPAAEPVLVPAGPPPAADPTAPPEPPDPQAPTPLHPEPRPPLVVLDTTSSAEAATHWFCGYCGAPAADKTPSPVSRVCPRCEQGLLLEAPAEAAPGREDAFLIVDSNLRVQAVSRRAEQILGVSETEATNLPVTELIGDAEAERDHVESFAVALTRTAVSDETGASAFVRPRESFGIRMRARITHCGPPRAALIVLEAPDTAPRLRLVRAERQARADERRG